MANELIENSSFGLKYTPAKLEMERYDDMKEAVKTFADKYDGLVFTADEKSGATEARSELIAIKNSLESERKNVKREYNKPLKEFESRVKDLVTMIDKPLNDIRDGLKDIEEGEREERERALQSILESLTKDSTVSIDQIEQPSNWLNKGNFTSKLKPTSKFEKEIESAIKEKEREIEHEAAQKRIVKEFCESKEIDPGGWLQQLEYRSATEIMDAINQDEKRRKEKEEQQRQMEEEIAKKKEEVQESPFEVEPETEPEVEPIPELELEEEFEEDEEELISDVIEVTGTAQQLRELNDYFKSSGIKVKKVDDVYAIDDLPF